MISVDENLICSFQVLKPAEKKQKFGAGGASLLCQRSLYPLAVAVADALLARPLLCYLQLRAARSWASRRDPSGGLM
jgi:serine/threonine-protein phosphatase PP1 catalytic subunit